jgi:hypothetical protein
MANHWEPTMCNQKVHPVEQEFYSHILTDGRQEKEIASCHGKKEALSDIFSMYIYVLYSLKFFCDLLTQDDKRARPIKKIVPRFLCNRNLGFERNQISSTLDKVYRAIADKLK